MSVSHGTATAFPFHWAVAPASDCSSPSRPASFDVGRLLRKPCLHVAMPRHKLVCDQGPKRLFAKKLPSQVGRIGPAAGSTNEAIFFRTSRMRTVSLMHPERTKSDRYDSR